MTQPEKLSRLSQETADNETKKIVQFIEKALLANQGKCLSLFYQRSL
jgi:hypothetical protein